MTTEQKRAYEIYAASALQALISKLPLHDTEGEFSKKYTQEELESVKRELTRSAHGYAWYMVVHQQEFTDSLGGLNKHEDLEVPQRKG